jgi:hypothetical protein
MRVGVRFLARLGRCVSGDLGSRIPIYMVRLLRSLVRKANSPAVQGLAGSTAAPCPSALVLIGLLWLASCGGECTRLSLTSASNEDSGDGVTRRIVLWDVCGRVGDESMWREARDAVCGRMDVAIGVVAVGVRDVNGCREK